MKIKTSAERVREIENLSDRVYPVIDQVLSGGEARARRITRLGINAIAISLQQGRTLKQAGKSILSLITGSFTQGGLFPVDSVYKPFPEYRQAVMNLGSVGPVDVPLDVIAKKYADVHRGTLDAEGNLETNARHAAHLAAWNVPYAMRHHPELDPYVIAAKDILHDFSEWKYGDTPTLGVLKSDEAKDKEKQALKEFAESPKGKQFPEFVEALYEYEAQQDDHSIFVRTTDKIDPHLTHKSNGGAQLINAYNIRSREEFLRLAHKTTESIATYGSHFPMVMEDRDELLKRVAYSVNWPDITPSD